MLPTKRKKTSPQPGRLTPKCTEPCQIFSFKAEGRMKQKINLKHLHDIPPISISLGTMLWNETGSWRYLRPKYVAKTPPCNEACPAGNDVEGFMVLARQGKFREAWELIKEESPFPGVCGRG